MKKLTLLLFVVVLFSGCSTLTKIYSMSRGKLAIAKQESYQVVYEANFGTDMTANVSYTNADGKLTKLKNIVGEWKQTVVLKTGTHVQMLTLAKGGKTDAHYKITVDGKVANEESLTAKRIRYNYSFELP